VRCERRGNGPVGDSAYVHHCRRRRPSLELRCVSHLQASQSGHCRCAIADRIVPSSELNAVQRHCRCEARATHARPSTEVELPRCNPIPGETPSPPPPLPPRRSSLPALLVLSRATAWLWPRSSKEEEPSCSPLVVYFPLMKFENSSKIQ
jgi:hypothetical protein